MSNLKQAPGVSFRQTAHTYDLVFEDGCVLSHPSTDRLPMDPAPEGSIITAARFRRPGDRYRYYLLWTNGVVTEEGSATCPCDLPVTKARIGKDAYHAEALRLSERTRAGGFRLVRVFDQPVRPDDVAACLDELLAQVPTNCFIGYDWVSHSFACGTCGDWIELGADTYRGPAFVRRRPADSADAASTRPAYIPQKLP